MDSHSEPCQVFSIFLDGCLDSLTAKSSDLPLCNIQYPEVDEFSGLDVEIFKNLKIIWRSLASNTDIPYDNCRCLHMEDAALSEKQSNIFLPVSLNLELTVSPSPENIYICPFIILLSG